MVRGYLDVSDNVEPKHAASSMEQEKKIAPDLARMKLNSLQPVECCAFATVAKPV